MAGSDVPDEDDTNDRSSSWATAREPLEMTAIPVGDAEASSDEHDQSSAEEDEASGVVTATIESSDEDSQHRDEHESTDDEQRLERGEYLREHSAKSDEDDDDYEDDNSNDEDDEDDANDESDSDDEESGERDNEERQKDEDSGDEALAKLRESVRRMLSSKRKDDLPVACPQKRKRADETGDESKVITAPVRATKLKPFMEEIIKCRELVQNFVPAFPQRQFETCNDLTTAKKLYCTKYNLKIRIRNSKKTQKCNKMEKAKAERMSKGFSPVPSRFVFAFREFYCTHGVIQPPRGKGKRAHAVRFTGCPARFIAEVRQNERGQWLIYIDRETSVHNHPTNKDIADSYFGAGDINVSDEELGAVADLVDNRANSKHITAFISDTLGKNLSAQQALNIIQKIEGKHSSEARLQRMLDALVNSDDNEVLLLQDQTHGTNNLGYHLGSLVVTSPSGRGIPILDFLSLNEQAEILRHVFEFLKSKNRMWPQIKSFVIDKDCAEWSILKTCFPDAKVLLCQFYVIQYWKKVLQMPKYNLKMIEREEIGALIFEMIYSSTKWQYESYNQAFSDYCRKICPKLPVYYDKNWKTCLDMWCNYARGKYVSAGNSTTNRIEANWNQVKLLLGKKPRIDKSVAGLLSHQLSVFRQFNPVIRLHSTRSRTPDLIPPFLRNAAGKLSDYALSKVLGQWDKMITHLQDAASCVSEDSSAPWR